VRQRRTIDTRKARICYPNGEVERFKNQVFAFAVWLASPRRTRAAFRGANDARPVYPWDFVDRR